MVVHTRTEALLIKRADHPEFWQSVTGSLCWSEAASTAARRELLEETGINADSSTVNLRATGIVRNYAILEQWRHRYPPGVTRNREHLYYCRMAEKIKVRLNADEHVDYAWVDVAEAAQRVYSWTNRLALSVL